MTLQCDSGAERAMWTFTSAPHRDAAQDTSSGCESDGAMSLIASTRSSTSDGAGEDSGASCDLPGRHTLTLTLPPATAVRTLKFLSDAELLVSSKGFEPDALSRESSGASTSHAGVEVGHFKVKKDWGDFHCTGINAKRFTLSTGRGSCEYLGPFPQSNSDIKTITGEVKVCVRGSSQPSTRLLIETQRGDVDVRAKGFKGTCKVTGRSNKRSIVLPSRAQKRASGSADLVRAFDRNEYVKRPTAGHAARYYVLIAAATKLT